MRQTKKHALLWLAAGILFSLLVFAVVVTGLSGKVFVTDPEGIPEAADLVMECIRSDDRERLADAVDGHPVLTSAAANADSAEAVIWEAYRKSLQWSHPEDFRIRNDHVTLRIAVTCLDIRAVTDAMMGPLKTAGADAADPELRAQLLRAAAQQVLDTRMPVTEQEITLTFLRKEGRWLVVPDRAFQALLSGFTAR